MLLNNLCSILSYLLLLLRPWPSSWWPGCQLRQVQLVPLVPELEQQGSTTFSSKAQHQSLLWEDRYTLLSQLSTNMLGNFRKTQAINTS